MKIKNLRTDELVDALKQLQIKDRRPRAPTKGRTSSMVALFSNSMSFAGHRGRLTRSASSATATSSIPGATCSELCASYLTHEPSVFVPYDVSEMCGVPDLCESCRSHVLIGSSVCGLTPALHSRACAVDPNTVDTGLAPFMTSAGLLHTCLPPSSTPSDPHTTDYSTVNGRRAFNCAGLRRSYGAGLSRLESGNRAIPRPNSSSTTARSQSSSSSVAVGTNFSCINCGSYFAPSSHVYPARSYRRLFGLIDHPCVSLYQPPRYHFNPSTLPRRSSGGFPFPTRYSLPLRNRPAFGTAGGPTLQVPTQPFIANQNVSSPTAIPMFRQHNQDSERHSATLGCTPWNRAAYRRSFRHKAKHSSSNTFGASRPDSPYVQSGAHLAQASYIDDTNAVASSCRCRRNSDPEHWQQPRICRAVKHGLLGATEQEPIGRSIIRYATCSHKALSFEPEDNEVDELFNNDCELKDQSTRRATNNYPFCGKLLTGAVQRQPPTSNYSSQMSIPNSNLLYQSSSDKDRGLRVALSNAQPSTSNYNRFSFSQHAGGDSVAGSSMSMNPTDLRSVDTSRIPVNLDEYCLGKLKLEDPGCVSNVQDNMAEVSVEELAAYMEHMVHIPGRMSEMAQRMYL